MRNRKPLTSLVALAGASALVGCASPRVEYATSHGYHPTALNGQEYYCKPRLAFPGESPRSAVNCLSLAQVDSAPLGNESAQSAPAMTFDPFLFRRVLIDGQERICSYQHRCSSPTDFEAAAHGIGPAVAYFPPEPPAAPSLTLPPAVNEVIEAALAARPPSR